MGSHLIIDVWGAKSLDDVNHIERALRAMTEAAGASLINVFLHHFGVGGGVTGVAIFAESHISIHTWPEHDFAAFDIFMCGNADVRKTIPVIQEMFSPERIEETLVPRGILSPDMKAAS